MPIVKLSHKFGFGNPEEFENAIKFISSIYRQHILELIPESELLSHFAHLNADYQKSVLAVFAIRRNEIEEFLINEHNSQTNKLLMSFDWDIRWILGTSNMASLRSQIATLILNCNSDKSDLETIHMELTRKHIDQLIEILEQCQQKMSISDT